MDTQDRQPPAEWYRITYPDGDLDELPLEHWKVRVTEGGALLIFDRYSGELQWAHSPGAWSSLSLEP